MAHRFGLYNKNFQMASQEMLEEKLEEVRGQTSSFKIVAGPLKWGGNILKDTYVLEVHYKNSEDAHSQRLPLNGFNSMLCYDYADKAMELANQFCGEQGLVVNNHLNSWPEYQAVVSRKPQQ